MVFYRLLYVFGFCVLLTVLAEAGARQDFVITKVNDGDSLRAGAERLRLFGIDAPELKQACIDKNGLKYACGQAAKDALLLLLAHQKTLSCEIVDIDHYKRKVARCFQADKDISQWLVEKGLAVAYLAYSKDYHSAQEHARHAKRGLWNGQFMMPDKWRRAKRSASLPAAHIIAKSP